MKSNLDSILNTDLSLARFRAQPNLISTSNSENIYDVRKQNSLAINGNTAIRNQAPNQPIRSHLQPYYNDEQAQQFQGGVQRKPSISPVGGISLKIGNQVQQNASYQVEFTKKKLGVSGKITSDGLKRLGGPMGMNKDNQSCTKQISETNSFGINFEKTFTPNRKFNHNIRSDFNNHYDGNQMNRYQLQQQTRRVNESFQRPFKPLPKPQFDEYAGMDEVQAFKSSLMCAPTSMNRQYQNVPSNQPFRPMIDSQYKRLKDGEAREQQIISVNPTIQTDAYDSIIKENENKQYDDNGELVNLGNPDDEHFLYEGEDKYKAYNLENQGKNEWRDTKFPWDQHIQEFNQKVFRNKTFLENQREIINAALNGKDVMALIPTGGGKSLTFQLTALMNNGYTFVIMPLIALIEDQIEQLRRLKVKCVYYNRSIKQGQFYTDLLANSDPLMKLIYLTPEKLVQTKPFINILDKLYQDNRIARFVIDEVHCVSHWGQDFRKDYRELQILRMRYPTVPMIVLTATATIAVKYDIVKHLKLDNIVFFQSSFNRPNLLYEIRDKAKIKKNIAEDIIMLLRDRKYVYQSGIIYCLSRTECEELCRELSEFDVKCDYYHAKMNENERRIIQQRWMRNEIHIIIATIAFGLGINKRDVRFVIHTTIPKSLENYAQECGRAGRDGENANCILYYSYADRKRLEFFIISNTENTAGRKNENLHALYKILEFCEEPYLCRRKILLNYLGEDFKSKKCNNMCDNCRKGLRVAEIDFTEQARYVVAMVESALKKKMDLTLIQICKFLRGKQCVMSNPNKTTKMDEIKQSYYGRLSDYSEELIKRIVMRLLINKVLKEKFNAYQVEATILVYLIPGRMFDAFKRGQMRIVLTDCLEKESENQYIKAKKKEDKDLKKKFHGEGEDPNEQANQDDQAKKKKSGKRG
eukprot:403364021